MADLSEMGELGINEFKAAYEHCSVLGICCLNSVSILTCQADGS